MQTTSSEHCFKKKGKLNLILDKSNRKAFIRSLYLNDLPAEMVCEVLRLPPLADLVRLKMTAKRYVQIVSDSEPSSETTGRRFP